MDLNALLLARKLLGGVSADDTLNPQDNLGNVTLPLPSQPQPTPNRFSSLFDQPGPAVSAYKQFLSTMPNRQDYEPSTGRRIAAALAGFAGGLRDPKYGAEIASDITDKPYKQAMEDYKVKGAGLQEAATLEDKEAGIKRQALRDDAIESLKQQGIALTTENILNEMKNRDAKTANDQAEFTRKQAADKELGRHHVTTEDIARTAANNATSDVSYFDPETFQNTVQKLKKSETTGKKFIKPLTGQPLDNLQNSQTILEQIDSLRSMTPQLQSTLGPISGNEEKFNQWFGDSKNQTAREASTLMDQLALLHAKIGGRASSQMFDEMKSSLKGINQNPQQWDATLNGIETTALNRIKGTIGNDLTQQHYGDRLKKKDQEPQVQGPGRVTKSGNKVVEQ